MKLTRRIAPVLLALLALAAVEGGMHWHLSRHQDAAYPDLLAPFTQLPLEFRPADGSSDPARIWMGTDHPQLDELRTHLPYVADDLLNRIYQRPGLPLVQLYMVYSRVGEDRKHHPEICIRDVSGAPEDYAARKLVPLDPEQTRFAQRFRFVTGPSNRTTVYYWHYTLPPLPRPERDWLQTLHLQLRHPSPSLTVQVSTAAAPAELDIIEQSFVGFVDAALHARHLPLSAMAGCNRLPIGLVRE